MENLDGFEEISLDPRHKLRQNQFILEVEINLSIKKPFFFIFFLILSSFLVFWSIVGLFMIYPPAPDWNEYSFLGLLIFMVVFFSYSNLKLLYMFFHDRKRVEVLTCDKFTNSIILKRKMHKRIVQILGVEEYMSFLKANKEILILRYSDLKELTEPAESDDWLYHSGNPNVYGLYKWNTRTIDFKGIPPVIYGQFWTGSFNTCLTYVKHYSKDFVFEISRWEIIGLIKEGLIKLYEFYNGYDFFAKRNTGLIATRAENLPMNREYVIVPQFKKDNYFDLYGNSEWVRFMNRHRLTNKVWGEMEKEEAELLELEVMEDQIAALEDVDDDGSYRKYVKKKG